MGSRRSRRVPRTIEPCRRCLGFAVCTCFEGRLTTQKMLIRQAKEIRAPFNAPPIKAEDVR